jgi:hypothetical protein
MGKMREGDKGNKGTMDRNKDIEELRYKGKAFPLILNRHL